MKDNVETNDNSNTAYVPAVNCETPCYVVNKADNWMQENALMYRGNNASDCMVAAYKAGAMDLIRKLKFELLPACTDAIDSVSKCLSNDGIRCSPNMEAFVKVANALAIIDDFHQMINSDT